ncbi:MAG: hypothetical protein ACREX8_12750, partial [Gammaproteobacteria bacterium]
RCTVSRPDPPAVREAYGRELAELLNAVLAGDLATDWVSVERGVGGRADSVGAAPRGAPGGRPGLVFDLPGGHAGMVAALVPP